MTIKAFYLLTILSTTDLVSGVSRGIYRTVIPADVYPVVWSITDLDEGADFNKFRIQIDKTGDQSKSSDVLIQLTYPTSSVATASQYIVATFPSDGTTRDPSQFYVKYVSSGLLDPSGTFVVVRDNLVFNS